MFHAGKTQNPPIAATVASSFAYLAWTQRAGLKLAGGALRGNPQLYGLAALLTVGVVPFTLALMSPTNNRLLGMAARSGDGKGKGKGEIDAKEFAELVENWKTLNFVRGLLPLCASAVALVAMLA